MYIFKFEIENASLSAIFKLKKGRGGGGGASIWVYFDMNAEWG